MLIQRVPGHHLDLFSMQPSEGQQRAGNYRKRKLTFQGLRISIENERGSIRAGGEGAHAWAVSMPHHYGYILGTLGVDGDHFDCVVGPDDEATHAYVVTTRSPPAFTDTDEQKAMLGFPSEEKALEAFHAMYTDPRFLGGVTAIPMDKFKAMVLTTRADPRLLKSSPVLLPLMRPDHLRLGTDRATIKGNIRALIAAGRPQRQAVAISLHQARRSTGTLAKAILFFKAADLLPFPTPVAGHMRGGEYVAPYTSKRLKRPDGPARLFKPGQSVHVHAGKKLIFPDHAHLSLFHAGLRIADGGGLSSGDRDALWHHFRGYVEDDPEFGRPFSAPHHVDDLASDYVQDVVDGPRGTPGRSLDLRVVGSVVDPDKVHDYLHREIGWLRDWVRANAGIAA